jgi:porin
MGIPFRFFHYFSGFHGRNKGLTFVLKQQGMRIQQTLFSSFLLILCATSPRRVAAVETAFPDRTAAFGVGASYVGEVLGVLDGGLRRGSSYEGMACLSLTLDLERALGWRGGSVYLTGANTHGGTPSERLIGDFQIASNIEAGNLTYVQECYFRQDVGRFSLMMGLQELNVEMLSSEVASDFINSSFGTHSTVSSGVPAPIFPLTSLGVQCHYRWSGGQILKLAFYDGMPEDFDTNPHNVSWRWNSKDGFLAFVEGETTHTLGNRPGRCRLGAYYHDHSDSRSDDKRWGGYLTVDQLLSGVSEGRNWSAFAQLGMTFPIKAVENALYVGAGLRSLGLLPTRSDDVFGVAVAYADRAGGGETTLELTYKCALGVNVFVQPDLQYVWHPSGTSLSLSHACVGLLRWGVVF